MGILNQTHTSFEFGMPAPSRKRKTTTAIASQCAAIWRFKTGLDEARVLCFRKKRQDEAKGFEQDKKKCLATQTKLAKSGELAVCRCVGSTLKATHNAYTKFFNEFPTVTENTESNQYGLYHCTFCTEGSAVSYFSPPRKCAEPKCKQPLHTCSRCRLYLTKGRVSTVCASCFRLHVPHKLTIPRIF